MIKNSNFAFFFGISLLLFGGGNAMAAGASESAASSTYAAAIAERGIIVRPENVSIDSYVGQIDFGFPAPREAFDAHFLAGNMTLRSDGGDAFLLVGIQAARTPFEDLPPMNLSFVIDVSGSMSLERKIDWVKKAFAEFMGKVRDRDYVSLVVFSDKAKTVFPSRRMDSSAVRAKFLAAVEGLSPGGGTDLVCGLERGYAEVMANYRKEYNNRVIFLTDGDGRSEGILEMASGHRDRLGVNVSVVGLGSDFNAGLMTALAREGGGSSRFLRDEESLKETFGSGFDRMVMPCARNVELRVYLPEGAYVKGSWGLPDRMAERSVAADLATLHNGDYETLLIEASFPSGAPGAVMETARLEVSYTDLDGEKKSLRPILLSSLLSSGAEPYLGISEPRVLRAAAMRRFGEVMERVGSLYYGNADRSASDEAVELARGGIVVLQDAERRLGESCFRDEIDILYRYLSVFEARGSEGAASSEGGSRATFEPRPTIRGGAPALLANMFDELLLRMDGAEGAVSFVPFASADGSANGLIRLVDEAALSHFAAREDLVVVERARVDAILREWELDLGDLSDTDTALRVGRLLAAKRIVTGTVLPMKTAAMVFCRVIDIESGRIECVAQSVLPMDEDLESLLRG